MGRDGYLLHTDFIESAPFGNAVTARLLNKRIDETLIDDPMNDPSITVAVRSYNEASKLEKLLEDVHRQAYKSELEVVVVDNASSDRTAEVVEQFGARLVTLPKGEFTYPKSMNLAMEAASHDVVFLTVAHARLSNVHSLHAGARHFAKDARVAGVFGKVLPNEGASYIERWVATIDNNMGLAKPAQRVSKAGKGALARCSPNRYGMNSATSIKDTKRAARTPRWRN
jgi:glycosyltransferase involved in cell wall biosynthesis